jgi:hypothetical protein
VTTNAAHVIDTASNKVVWAIFGDVGGFLGEGL